MELFNQKLIKNENKFYLMVKAKKDLHKMEFSLYIWILGFEPSTFIILILGTSITLF